MRYKSYLILVVFMAALISACGGGGGGASGGSASGGGSSNTGSSAFSVSGAVTGLNSGEQLVLQDNGGDPLSVSINSTFTFSGKIAQNGSYAVTVGTNPVGQVCTVSNGTGSGVVANVTNIAVACSTDTYSISSTITGLASGQTLTLLNNSANALSVTANGNIAFPAPVAYNGGYSVTVASQPLGQICTVSNGQGSGVIANIENVIVTCSTDTYPISGNVTGLAAAQQVTLNNNGTNPITLMANSSFSFSTPVAYNGSYSVTVGTQPVGQTCSVLNGTGAGVIAAVSNVSVVCSTDTYSISGTVTGLATGQQVVLNNNGTNPVLVTANSPFSFSVPVAYNGSYSVSVGTQPLNQTCSVVNGTGSGVVAAVSNISIVCSSDTYTISGEVVNLNNGQQLTILNNGANPTILTPNSQFTFSVPVAFGGSYAVTVGTQPIAQQCTVQYGSGSNISYNILGVEVDCASTLTILHAFSGGATDGANAAGNLTLGSDGNFYGTTAGGFNNNGAIFKISPAGVYTLLYAFTGNNGGSDGASPLGSLTLGQDGNFYGITIFGGTAGVGTIFKVTPAGVETVLHSFSGSEGFFPSGSLVLGTDGNFYGLASLGGANGKGSVFKVTPTGIETTIYSFTGTATDGANPNGNLVLGTDGNFYGLTFGGGSSGNGTVFKVTPAGIETPLYSFTGVGIDGAMPNGSLLLGPDNNFYGLTTAGGTHGKGTVFKVTSVGIETPLYSFIGSGNDGANPNGNLTLGSDGNFYGMTENAGANSYGTLFKITPAGVEVPLYPFTGGGLDGGNPRGSLILGSDGHLYGMTFDGGSNGAGTIFKY